MKTVTKRLYEGMFLVDSAEAAADWEGTLSFIGNILQRADAEVVSMRKWQERKLAYEIDHKTRGTYILCYFNASGERIAGIEKDVLLSEKVMRVLILGTEKRPPEMIETDIKGDSEGKTEEKVEAKPVEAPAAPAKPEVAVPAEAPSEPPAASPSDEPLAASPSDEAPAASPSDEAGDGTPAPATGETDAEPEATEKAAE